VAEMDCCAVAADLWYEADLEGQLVAASDDFLALVGYERAGLVGKSQSVLLEWASTKEFVSRVLGGREEG
jgi:PAS domain S-box-containing protein